MLYLWKNFLGRDLETSIILSCLSIKALKVYNRNNKRKSYFEITLTTIVRIEDKIEKEELEKILLCDVQEEIRPELEKAFLNMLNNSGYTGFNFEKKIDFEKLYKQKTN